MAKQPLSHIKVVDLTQRGAGPYCTKLMAGFGADVVKAEPPETGDPQRAVGPFFQDRPGRERSIPFLWLNTGKQSVTLNLQAGRGVELLKRLVADADVLVENFAPGTMAELGLAYETLQQANPRLVMTSLSNFGQTGPYRDYLAEESQSYALSGLMYETGHPDQPPLAAGPAVAQYSAALVAYTATLTALFLRHQTGRGQHVDVSVQEAALVNIEMSLTNCLQSGKVRKRSGDRHVMVPWEMYPCADGEAAVVGGPIRHWDRAAEIFDEPRMFADKFRHCRQRIEHRQEFEALLAPCVRKMTGEELFQAGQQRRLGFACLRTLEEALQSPQHQARGLFEQIKHPEVGAHGYVGAPFKLSATPWRSARAPLLGEHNQAVYGERLGCTADEMERLRAEGII